MQGKGWIVLGIVVGVGGGSAVLAGRADASPLLLAALVVAASAALGLALYFRAHWAATARALRTERLAAQEGADRMTRIGDDLERGAWVIADNLQEVHAEGRAGMFLDGARAHARKMVEIAARCRGVAERLRAGPDSR